jgi:hypothetical protein
MKNNHYTLAVILLVVVASLSAMAIPHPNSVGGDPVYPSGGYSIDRATGKVTLHDPAMADYDRTAYGSGWIDADRDCLDTRAEILVRDGENVRVEGCRVVAGKWVDPYTGAVESNPSNVDVDHVYALAHAWRQGASDWTRSQRIAFANDPNNLMAVQQSVNSRKSDQALGEWCEYNPGEKVKNECPSAGSEQAFEVRYQKVAARYDLQP